MIRVVKGISTGNLWVARLATPRAWPARHSEQAEAGLLLAVDGFFPARNGTGLLDVSPNEYLESQGIGSLGGLGFHGAAPLFVNIPSDWWSTRGSKDRGKSALCMDLFDRLGHIFHGVCHLGCELESLVVRKPVRYLFAIVRAFMGTPHYDGAHSFGTRGAEISVSQIRSDARLDGRRMADQLQTSCRHQSSGGLRFRSNANGVRSPRIHSAPHPSTG